MIGVEEASVPGNLKPRAISALAALAAARNRSMSAWLIAKRIGDEDALHVIPLLHDMAALGLVERGGGVGYRSVWRSLVAGPVRP